jgi:ATP adenylyltransferase
MEKLWAPWRIEYINNPGSGCFLCAALKKKDPAEALVLETEPCAFSIMNRYPYNNGHMLVAPTRHVSSLEELDDREVVAIHRLASRAIRAIARVMRAQGFNVGINQGRVAGAGLIDHVHVHIVPRWQGDTNFMPLTADVKVLSEALAQTFRKIKEGLDTLDNPYT